MTASNRIYFWIGMALFLPLAYFLFDRIDFALSSQQAVAAVERISAHNTRCGKRGRRASTKFVATLKYQVSGRDYRIDVNSGRTRGYDQSVQFANHYAGAQEKLVYDLRRPERAYHDTTWAVWHAPILILLVQIAFFIGSMNDKDRRDAEMAERLARWKNDTWLQQRRVARR